MEIYIGKAIDYRKKGKREGFCKNDNREGKGIYYYR